MTSTLNEGKRAAESAYRDAQPWVIRLARWGYAAKGIVYLLIGGLALGSVLTTSGQTTGPTGALQEVASQPFGQVMLALIAIGLAGYAIWRFVQAIKDPDKEGSDAKGIFKRIGYAVSGIAYVGLAVSAVGLIMGTSGGGSGNQAEDITAQVMAQPYGPWLLGLVALGLMLYGVYSLVLARYRRIYATG